MSAGGWRDVWLLALVSLIADISGEMVLALLPILLVAQGATGLGIGLVDGVTEGVGHLFKYIGAQVGARTKRQRLLIGSGYMVAALGRFGVAFAATWPATLAFRSLDRVGKGMRTAPRDAMLARLIESGQRARAYGLHLAGDTMGGVLGVLLVLLFIPVLGLSTQTTVLVGSAIGLFAIVPLFWVRDRLPTNGGAEGADEPPSPHYGAFLAVSALFSLGRLSYMFYIVRVLQLYGEVRVGILFYLLFIVTQAASAVQWGRTADRIGKSTILAVGFLLFSIAPVVFILSTHVVGLAVGIVLLGLALACVEGTGRALAAGLSGSLGRIGRLGEYQAITGFATLLGGIAAGLLWDNAGISAAFAWGAAVPLVGLAGLVWLWPHIHTPRRPAAARTA
ncbi:MAG: MFS transporter [Candidatus Thermoplasmatota archaeon]|jgi:MFS family permease